MQWIHGEFYTFIVETEIHDNKLLTSFQCNREGRVAYYDFLMRGPDSEKFSKHSLASLESRWQRSSSLEKADIENYQFPVEMKGA